MKRLRRRACCCGCLFLLLAGLVPVSLVMLPPPAPPPLAPAARARAKEHIAEVKREIQSLQKAIVTHKPRPFTLRLTEQEMNTFLETDNEAQRIMAENRIEKAFVRIEEGQVKATAFCRLNGPTVAVTGAFLPLLREDGTLDYRLQSLSVGRLGMPDTATRRLADDLARKVGSRLVNPALKFRALSVEGDVITLTGNTQ